MIIWSIQIIIRISWKNHPTLKTTTWFIITIVWVLQRIRSVCMRMNLFINSVTPLQRSFIRTWLDQTPLCTLSFSSSGGKRRGSYLSECVVLERPSIRMFFNKLSEGSLSVPRSCVYWYLQSLSNHPSSFLYGFSVDCQWNSSHFEWTQRRIYNQIRNKIYRCKVVLSRLPLQSWRDDWLLSHLSGISVL